MLKVKNLEAAYGASQVLFGISFEIDNGETLALLGRNGMGKTTAVKSIMGLLRPCGGHVSFKQTDITEAPPFRIARLGLGLVPEGRQIFPNLTVMENLVATAANRRANPNPWTAERVFGLFPELAARATSMGNLLSGGEQQMLAIGRALMTNPELLILDEATEGLAPLIRREIWQALEQLRAEGLSILIIDKNIADLVQLADRHVILEKGRIVWRGTSAELSASRDIQHRFLGV
jgi:branched-chain amino acid transport system ATP-binding protein